MVIPEWKINSIKNGGCKVKARSTGLVDFLALVVMVTSGGLFSGCYTAFGTRAEKPPVVSTDAYQDHDASKDTDQVNAKHFSPPTPVNTQTESYYEGGGQDAIVSQTGNPNSIDLKNCFLYLDKKKDTGGAIAWWLVFPGAGPMYAHDYAAGWVFATCEVASVCGMLFAKKANPSTFAEVYAVSKLVELPWTIIAVNNYNASLRSRFYIQNIQMGFRHSVQSGISLSFAF